MFWQLKLVPVEKQPVFLTSEPSLLTLEPALDTPNPLLPFPGVQGIEFEASWMWDKYYITELLLQTSLLFFNEKFLCVCISMCDYRHEHSMAEIRGQACVLAFSFHLLVSGLLIHCCIRQDSWPHDLPKFSSFCLPSYHRSAWITDTVLMWVLGIWTQVFRLARSTLFMEPFLQPGYGFFFNISVMRAYSNKFKVIQDIIIKNSLQ